jgi:hypothetical protein
MITVAVVLLVMAGWMVFRREVILQVMQPGAVADLAGLVGPASVTAWLAPRVAYRWFDALWWLFLPLGLALLVQSVWRATLLPYRNWPPRPGEVHRLQPVEGVTVAHRKVYLLGPRRDS